MGKAAGRSAICREQGRVKGGAGRVSADRGYVGSYVCDTCHRPARLVFELADGLECESCRTLPAPKPEGELAAA
jgi:hypothetical protein